MIDALDHAFFQRALAAGLLVSVACGIVGTYVVVKRISSISGSLAHAAFGGVGLGYLVGFDPMIGATGFSLFSSFGLGLAYRHAQNNLDTLLSMIWSIGMALGLLFIALTPGSAPDLMSYLFGSILFVPSDFLVFVSMLDIVAFLLVLSLYRHFQAVTFDEEFAQVSDISVGPIMHILFALIALTVVMLIKVVGVILVIALLTFPASIARHWTHSLVRMMIMATVISGLCTTAGLFGSYWISTGLNMQIPTGPLTILVATFLYIASLLFRRLRRNQ